MKYFLLTVCCSLVAIAAQAKTSKMMNTNVPHKIMVLSDIHLLAPSLHNNSKASQRLDSKDMKLALQSDLIMEKMVDEIISEKPQLLFISGDLTFDGARVSHERLAEHLQRLQRAGVKTLVVPGNHDVMNPHSRNHLGDIAAPVANITSEEFALIYHDFGYDDNSRRDPNSLSYTCEPVPGLMLLCIDSNIYAANRDEEELYHSNGEVKPETLDWIRQQLAEAQKGGKRVIAMMHHHLVEHIDGEARFLPSYIVAHHDQVAQVLKEGGVKAVFTGHLHITDAATSDGITDIATGSASTYPLPVRIATIDPSLTTMTIETHFFEGIDKKTLDKGRAKIEGAADALAGMISRELWSKISTRLGQFIPLLEEQGIDTSKLPLSSNEVAQLITKHLREPLAQSLLTVSRGGEDPTQAQAIIEAVKQGVRGMAADVIPQGDDEIAEFLIKNLMPRVEPTLRSALEDINQVGTSTQSTTHDHKLTIKL